MNGSYKKIIDSCEKFSDTAQSDRLKAYVSWTRSALEEKHVPTAVIAEMGLDVAAFIHFASVFCGDESLKLIGDKLPHTQMCISLEKGEKLMLYRVTSDGTEAVSAGSLAESAELTELIITVPSQKLSGMKLILMIGVEDPGFWRGVIDQTDILCLRTNATMAMTLDEKKWIETVASKRFGSQNFGVWIDKMNLLNNDSDVNDVLDVVNAVVSKFHTMAKNLCSMQEAIDFTGFVASDKTVDTLREKRIVRNLLNDCREEISMMLSSDSHDSGGAAKAISSLESARNRIVMAGQIASRTTFANAMNELSLQVKESARDYNTQICGHIHAKINATGDKELEKVADQIEPYIRNVWSYYSSEISRATKPEMEAIFDKITARMEEDAGALYSMFDNDTVRIIQQSFETVQKDSWNLGAVSFGEAGIDATNPIYRLKKSTRFSMLLSVPLMLVNPYLGAASLASAGIIGGINRKRAAAEYRSHLTSQVDSMCDRVLDSVIAVIDARFKDASAQSADNITKAYNGIVDILVGQIKEMEKKQADLRKRRSSLEAVVNDARITTVTQKHFPFR